ncbi:MT-A70 family methyltransferase [Myxococcota bacterium]|nr:MT-A70 family methyltransferase [Myxococcota bacterium]
MKLVVRGIEYATHPASDLFPMMEQPQLLELAESISRDGLLESIIEYEGKILDGRNRLLACELARVEPRFHVWTKGFDGPSATALVIALNAKRRHLTEGQRSMVAARAKPLFEAEAKERMREAGREKGQANLPDAGQARDHAAKLVGVSPRTVEHACSVLRGAVPEVIAAVDAGKLAVSSAADLAKLPPDRQRAVLARADLGRAGNVRALVRQEDRQETAGRINAQPTPDPSSLIAPAAWRVLVADPPWAYKKRPVDPTNRAAVPYPTLSVEELCALEVDGHRVADLAHPEGCVLWLWVTNAFMREGFQILDAWGFEQKTILTWDKERIGIGEWLRGQTEHVLVAIKGHPIVRVTNESTLLKGAPREHSRKPETFYELVERICPGSKLELFARQPRAGWSVWGAETDRFPEEAQQRLGT